LLTTVDDPDLLVRSSAANVLVQHREHAAQVISALLGLAQDKAPRVRETALFALEEIVRFVPPRSPEAQAVAQAAIAALDDPSPAVRLEACRALYVFVQGQKADPRWPGWRARERAITASVPWGS
jgi:HEAT repeat protein